MGVHRTWYPNARQGQDPKDVKPVAKADPIIDARGVRLEFFVPRRSYSPDELKMLARWLYSISHEAEKIGQRGLVSEEQAYDVSRGKVVPPPADK